MNTARLTELLNRRITALLLDSASAWAACSIEAAEGGGNHGLPATLEDSTGTIEALVFPRVGSSVSPS